MESNSNKLTCKVVLLGETGIYYIEYKNMIIGVGKTSIITRYVNNSFRSNFIPSISSGFITKEIYFQDYNQSIKFEVNNP